VDASKELSFFDHFAGEHGEYDVLGRRAYRRLQGVFDALVSPRKGEHCLDLGCGTGAFTRQLSAFGLDLTGMDISPRSIEAATRLSASENYPVGDIRATGFAAGRADIVACSGALHHCDQVTTRVEILREGYRLLKPGGRLL
jgi:malonyl-CoA O-methyltransferase